MKNDLKGHIIPLLCHGDVAWFILYFRSSDLKTTLTYVRMDNFCIFSDIFRVWTIVVIVMERSLKGRILKVKMKKPPGTTLV